jgi:TrmH family RNA methyltransferase
MKKTNKLKNQNVMESQEGNSLLSRRNDIRIARIRRLQQRQFRDQDRVFLCEGARFLFKAYEQGAHIESAVYAPQLMPGSLEKLLRQLDRRGVPLVRVSKEVFLSISLAEEPSGLLAICGQQVRNMRKINPAGTKIWLAVDSVRSPGNLGTMMRTCDACGAAGMIVLDPDTDFYHPAAVRASMGSIFSLSLARCAPDELRRWCDRYGCTIFGTSPGAKQDYRSARFDAPTVVLMGSERKGISTSLESICDETVRIPMSGHLDSLNVAAAGAIVLYEVRHQLETRSQPP